MKRKMFGYLIGMVCCVLPGLGLAAQFDVTTPAELQAALVAAQSNGEDDTISIASGTHDISAGGTLVYAPAENFGLTISGADGAILDGGDAVRILSIDSTALGSDDSAHVALQNITIQNGNVSGSSGGGLWFQSAAADLTIDGVVFSGNDTSDSGGAAMIDTTSGTILIRNSTFSGNHAGNCSGAIELSSDSGDVTYANNTFSGNIADECDSGAIYIELSSGALTLTDNTFQSNQCADGPGGAGLVSTSAGAITLNGNIIDGNSASKECGGLCVSSSTGAITIDNNAVTANTATGAGGTPGNYGGMLVETESGSVIVTQNTFSDNAANGVPTASDDEGLVGGLMVTNDGGGITLVGNRFQGNSASNIGGGGAVETLTGDIIMANNIVANNTAVHIGGGFGVLTQSGELSIVNNTIVDNAVTDAAAYCGGLYVQVDDGGIDGLGQANILNNIIWGNLAAVAAADIYIDDDHNGDMSGGIVALFFNDYSDARISYADHYTFGDNIDADPLLTATYHLSSTSPCIDAGENSAPDLPAVDIDGVARIIDGDNDGAATADMGADEYTDQEISVDQDSITFSRVAIASDPASATVTISNIGGFDLSITALDISGDDADDFSVDAVCDGVAIPGGSDCTMTVQFSPASTGAKAAVLTIASDDPDNPTVAVALAGIATDGISSSGGGGGGGGCFIRSLQ